MIMKHLAILLAAICFATPAFADDKDELETVMAAYLEAWNAHDAATITSTYYRLDSDHPWGTLEGMTAQFDRLVSQGYDKSDISSIRGCVLTEDTGQVELRYRRLTTDGGFMPPEHRASIYRLRKFEDGWHITGFAGMPAEETMDCPSDNDG